MTGCTPLADSPWADARWLVLAPHPDDETLGAGALIADAAARGRFAGVVYLTDGSGSHPHADDGTRLALIATRKREAERAVRLLTAGVGPDPRFLDWVDAAPCPSDSAAFANAVDRLAGLCRSRSVTALAVTAAHEPHCDHAAAFGLAEAVCRGLGGAVRLFQYRVWATTPPVGCRAVRTPVMDPGVRAAALAAHASQLQAGGAGFSLGAEQRRMAAFDVLYTHDAPEAGDVGIAPRPPGDTAEPPEVARN